MTTGRLPSPDTTAAIILGASDFPYASQFESSPQFSNSAKEFRAFLLADDGFRLPEANLLDLFDTTDEQSLIIRNIANFLIETRKALEARASTLSDVIFYYVGHGGFDSSGSSRYFLAIKQTNTIDYLSSSVSAVSLRRALREHTRAIRHYLILDCCFAAAAVAPYMSSSATAQAMVTQVEDEFPPSGTALLCASGALIPARAKRGAKFTMFSEALLEILCKGAPNSSPIFSLNELGIAVRSLLKSRYGDEAVRPEVQSPEQSQGCVARIPIFRNAFARLERETTPVLSEDVLIKEGQPAGHADPVLRDMFREFDVTDIPAKVSSYSLSETEWAQIPLEVRRMLKQIEGLPSRAQRLASWFFLLVPIGCIAFLFVSGNRGDFTTAGFVAIGLGLPLTTYHAFAWYFGERVSNQTVLRARTMNSEAWELFPVMDLLRRPRELVRFRGRAFLEENLLGNISAGLVSLFFGAIILLSSWQNPR
jgi:hypothetical protein